MIFARFFTMPGTNPNSIVVKHFGRVVGFSEIDSVFWRGNFLENIFDFVSFRSWLMGFLMVQNFTLFLSLNCILFNNRNHSFQSFSRTNTIVLFFYQVLFIMAFKVIYDCLWVLVADNLIIQIVHKYSWNFALQTFIEIQQKWTILLLLKILFYHFQT